MTGIPGAALLVLAGYLIGAIPVGLMIGRLVGGIDLRQHGSGRTGATNTLRTIGIPWALGVFVLDLAKGALPVLLVGWLYSAGPAGSPAWVAAAAGVAAIGGHVRSVFIRFTGGRGVATFVGAMFTTAPLVVAVVIPLALLIIWRTRFVSLGSLSGAVLAPVATALLVASGRAELAGVGLAAGGAAVVIAAHADNIARLRAGTERRLGR
ncbi:MAG: glycerol-3-phosphate 1-O-acyltransferase PlsY [Chloroflexota bacterium]